MTEFRRASNDLKATFDREMQTLERETKPVKAATETIARQIRDETYSYPSASVWTALEQGNDTATDSTSVGASEVSGAESQGTSEPSATSSETVTAATEVATAEEPPSAAPEGTVPRGKEQPSPTQNS
jgi:sec-independent protein translocase protein TatA